ncbi:MAG TPA: hypothetical protein VMZ53_21085 [Kofleriaceae bacterium]|nr:hypothetical protein [Kofleriaceae bacterium]
MSRRIAARTDKLGAARYIELELGSNSLLRVARPTCAEGCPLEHLFDEDDEIIEILAWCRVLGDHDLSFRGTCVVV